MNLRIAVKKFNGDRGYVQYSTTQVGTVGSMSDKYKLTVGGFKGSLGMSTYFINISSMFTLYHFVYCSHHLLTESAIKKVSTTTTYVSLNLNVTKQIRHYFQLLFFNKTSLNYSTNKV